MMKFICCMIQMSCFLYLILKSLCYITYQSISSVKFPRAEHFMGRSNPPNIQQKYSTQTNFKLILREIFKRKFLIFFNVTGCHFFYSDGYISFVGLPVEMYFKLQENSKQNCLPIFSI